MMFNSIIKKNAMYKIKRFSLFGGSKFTPDMSDIESLNSYRDVLKAFPRLKSPQLDKIIRNQSKIRDLNFMMDNMRIWVDMQMFEFNIDDEGISEGLLDESSREVRKSMKSNDYIALTYDGTEYLAFEISTSKFVTIPYDGSKITKTYTNIGAYIEDCLKTLHSVLEDHIEFEMPEDEKSVRDMYDKYVKLVK